MAMRVVVSRCAKAAAARAATSVNKSAVLSVRRAVFAQTQTLQLVRASSSSRFLSLADDDGEKKSRRGDGEDGGDEEEDMEASEEDGDEDELSDEQEEIEMYKFCVTETEELDDEIMELFMSNPLQWTPLRLARKYGLSKQRIEATIFLQAESAGLSPEQLQTKIEEAKAAVKALEEETRAKLESAKARGDEKEIARLEKRQRQEQRDIEEVDSEELTPDEEAFLLGIDDERYRNPDFFFLSDAYEGLPPLTRRLGKHKATDKLFPEEAIEIQRLAAKKTPVVEHKSFAKPTDKPSRWKFAVKDTTKNKLPLYIRGQDRALRLATKEEVLPRTWVRRPAYFSGLDI
jgi:hypothetical protein